MLTDVTMRHVSMPGFVSFDPGGSPLRPKQKDAEFGVLLLTKNL
jgi:hypothetical protein